jgi:hypothetical protein
MGAPEVVGHIGPGCLVELKDDRECPGIDVPGSLAGPSVIPCSPPSSLERPRKSSTSVFALPDGCTVLGGQIQELGDEVTWILAAYRPTVITPIGCLAVRRLGRRGGSITLALGRTASFAVEVTQFTVAGAHRRFLGRVGFGTRSRGLRTFPWSLRMHGQLIRPAANRTCVLTRRSRFRGMDE